MPNWTDILVEIQTESAVVQNPLDTVRRKYLAQYADYVKREVIFYYSGWLQKPGHLNTLINDDDKNGFMNAISGMRKDKGLDLFLHTQGGDIAATESIVNYLRAIFGNDIRVVIPQLAMSAGTMIACASREILMGKQSNLGPIDPQYGGVPAHGIIEEFNTALAEVKKDPASTPIWQQIVAKYPATCIVECKHAISWSSEIVTEWLKSGMFVSLKPEVAKALADGIVNNLGSKSTHKVHARHIHVDDLKNMGLVIKTIEDDQVLQDLILSVHHCYMHTLAATSAYKIIENHIGQAIFHNIQI